MSALYGVAVLACPVGMGLMKWADDARVGPTPARLGRPTTVAWLGRSRSCAEIEQLNAERAR